MSEYKRLTRKDEKGRWIADANHVGLYIDTTGKTRYGDVEVVYGDVVNRLAELENKIESGELVELPKKEAYVDRDGYWTVRVVYLGEDGRVHFEYCNTEQQADDFLKKEKARMPYGVSR